MATICPNPRYCSVTPLESKFSLDDRQIKIMYRLNGKLDAAARFAIGLITHHIHPLSFPPRSREREIYTHELINLERSCTSI